MKMSRDRLTDTKTSLKDNFSEWLWQGAAELLPINEPSSDIAVI